MATNESFIGRLLRIVPELKDAYDEHVADNDILLPHVFMGDVTRFVLAEISCIKGDVVVKRILDCLENEMLAGSAESMGLIRASFVENLVGASKAMPKLKLIMGPALRAEVEAICGN